MQLSYYEAKERQQHGILPVEKRFEGDGNVEIYHTYTDEQAIEESKRCMSCGGCFDCGTCWSYCQDNAIVKPLVPLGEYKFKLEYCNGCKKCAEQCPCGYIEMYDPASGQTVPLSEIKIGG
jgi:MinD superfamily P-loop ATPase